MIDPLTPYGNQPMVTPIVNAVNYEYRDFEVLRKITDGEDKIDIRVVVPLIRVTDFQLHAGFCLEA